MNKKIIGFMLVISFLLINAGCSKLFLSKNAEIKLPETSTPKEINQWAVTKYPGLKLRENLEDDSNTINYLPYGAIIEVIKNNKEISNFENLKDYWYYVNYNSEYGWIFGSYIEIYNTYDEAVKKSEEIIFNLKKE